VGVGWGVVCAALLSIRQNKVVSARALGRTSVAVLAVLALVGAGAALAASHRISDYVNRQYDAFVNLDVSGTGGAGQSRLGSGGGYRYDYWRVAWNVFRDEPAHGVGAGNYDVPYFARRRTGEDIRQPHSIELQTLAELGIPGGLALLGLVGCAIGGLVMRARRGRRSSRERSIAVAAGGTFFLWLAHTSVDWMHLIPGLTAIALASLAVLVSPPRPIGARPEKRLASRLRSLGTGHEERRVSPPRPLGVGPEKRLVRISAIAVALLLTALATVAVLRPTLAQHDRTVARSLLARNPARALAKANDAISTDDQEVRNWYVRSAALARLGLYEPARASLERAVALEPGDWVTWLLLGDTAARRGDLAQARRDYRRALALNPKGGFEAMIADPASVVRRP